jgi:hypothetical protein
MRALTPEQERWLAWSRKTADYVNEILQWFEGCPLPSERLGKDLVVEFYKIEVELTSGEPPRVTRSEPGGYAEPTRKT